MGSDLSVASTGERMMQQQVVMCVVAAGVVNDDIM